MHINKIIMQINVLRIIDCALIQISVPLHNTHVDGFYHLMIRQESRIKVIVI